MKKAIGLGLLTLLALTALGAAQAAEIKNTDNYHKALNAYLAGEYDQAILLDSKALEADPTSTKAKALLSVLVAEKESAGKTVIWIGGKPALVDKQAPVAPPVPIVQKEVIRTRTIDSKKIQELENRIQTVGLLWEKSSSAQYQELASAQAQLNGKLDLISKSLAGKGSWDLFSILALVLSALALGLSLRANRARNKELRVGLDRSEVAEESPKVVNFNRM